MSSYRKHLAVKEKLIVIQVKFLFLYKHRLNKLHLYIYTFENRSYQVLNIKKKGVKRMIEEKNNRTENRNPLYRLFYGHFKTFRLLIILKI